MDDQKRRQRAIEAVQAVRDGIVARHDPDRCQRALEAMNTVGGKTVADASAIAAHALAWALSLYAPSERPVVVAAIAAASKELAGDIDALAGAPAGSA